MKLLFINSSEFLKKNDGLYIYHETAKLMVELNKKYKVDAFHYAISHHLTDNLANFNLSSTDVKISPAKRYKSKIISYIKSYLILFLKIWKTDFLYVFYPNSFRFTVLFALFFNKKYALYVRGEKNLESGYSKYIFKKAKFVLTVSPKFTNDIKKINPNVFTIKPMIAYSKEDIVTDKKNLECYKFLYVGRVERDKGSLELVHAIEELVAGGFNEVVLTLVGNGEMLPELKAYVKEKELTKNIIFKGAIYDPIELKNIYKSNDIFIIPSHHEGFPRVLYEAMIFRLVILTTFVGTISGVMSDEENCMEIKVDDFKDISNKLKVLLQDRSLRQVLAEGGTKTIQEYLKNNSESHEDLIIQNFENEK